MPSFDLDVRFARVYPSRSGLCFRSQSAFWIWNNQFICVTVPQGAYDNRTIFDSLDLAWTLLRIFPRELLRRITVKTLDDFYERKAEA